MLATITKAHFGEDVYRLMEQVIENETPIEVEFKGKKLMISLAEYPGKLDKLEPHPECLIGDPEDIVHIDWSGEIHHDLP